MEAVALPGDELECVRLYGELGNPLREIISKQASADPLTQLKNHLKIWREGASKLWRPGRPRTFDTSQRRALLHTLPDEMQQFYSNDEGRSMTFRYRQAKPLALANESGVAPLAAIQMSWIESDATHVNLSEAHLRDALRVLETLPDLKLWVVKEQGSDETLMQRLALVSPLLRSRIQVVAGEEITHWAQDGAKALSHGGGLVVPALAARREDRFKINAAKALHQAGLVPSIQESPFLFEGGNVIVAKDTVFVGITEARDNMNRLMLSESELREALSTEFGKAVQILGFASPWDGNYGSPSQADYHIDLSMAVVHDRKSGKEVAFVESPLLALELLQAPSYEGTELKGFLDSWLQGPNAGELKRYFEEKILDPKKFKDILEREAQLGQLAEQVATEVEVRRIPGLNYLGLGKAQFFNYTNAFFSGNHAFIPRTGIDNWDNFAIKQFEGMGYKVVQMDSALAAQREKGGARCAFLLIRKDD